MEIIVQIVKENKDGSADAKVKFDKEGLEVLVQWGLVSMLTKGLNEYACTAKAVTQAIDGNKKRAKK